MAGGQAERKETKLSPEVERFFEAKIRPVLATQCGVCHGEKNPQGGLNLKALAGLMAGGSRGPALVPGDPDKSLFIQAIRYEDPHLKMPPAGKLPAAQIADLTQWVKMGAPWPGASAETAKPQPKEYRIPPNMLKHWAFQPVKRAAVPKVKNAAWVRNPIDAFILAKLEAKGLKPAPPASRQKLLRRAAYDLTGLPPTPQEMAAFLADKSPNAWEKVVDRLLASPRYGEKWARQWLDLVRYAETNSYERDNPKPHVWRYRDYVIRALNEDKPYTRFIREQLAGDELPDATNDSLIATGYYRLGIWDDEPTDRELAFYDGLDDIIATTGQTFLGLTLDCARCHDHKIDPIPQKDYYRFLSFFRNINHFRNGGPTDEKLLFQNPQQKQEYARLTRELEGRRNAKQAEITAVENEFRVKIEQATGRPVRTVDIDGLRYRFYRDTWDKLPVFDALKPETVGELPAGLFDLGVRSRDEAFGIVFEGTLIVPQEGDYTFHLDSDDGARLLIGGKKVIEYDGLHVLSMERPGAIRLKQGRVPIRLEYFQKDAGFGLQVFWSGPSVSHRPLVATGKAELERGDLEKRIAQEGNGILGAEKFAQYQRLKKERDDLRAEQVPVEKALCITERGGRAPETFVLLRGNPHAQGDPVEPRFPLLFGATQPSLPTLPENAPSSGRRLTLANWIASPQNKLTARVMVNRLWQGHFGRGIVRSVSNFGLQGDRPTHPGLLDWLAAEFVKQGWSLKKMHRLMMTSSAYRMSSQGEPKALAKDPANDLFWRFDMRRLTAEEIRDSILVACGTLNTAMYGPGVYPEIPAEVMAGQSIPGYGWGKSTPEERNRRSIYVHVKRSLLLPILESFDVAETDRTTPARFATTQPTQALGMLNSAFLNSQAAQLAARLRQEAGGDAAKQARLGLSLTLNRAPSAPEVQRGVALIETLQRDGVKPEVALTYFCLMAFNLNEFFYLD